MGRKTKEQVDREQTEKEAAFNDAVSAKVVELLPALMEQLAGARQASGHDPAPQGGDRALLEGLAHAMAKASDPGNKRRIVSPEIMQQREQAAERMRTLLIDYRATGRMPVYRIINKCFLSETLIDPQYRDPQTKEMKDQEINWNGVPNQAMAAVNDEATAVMKEFLVSISSVPRDFTKDPAPWVMSAGELLRGKPGNLRTGMVGDGAFSDDPRRVDSAGKPVRKTMKVLGSIAEPAVVGP